jgi:hypothetical protein
VLVSGHLVAVGTLEEIQRLEDPCVHSFFLGVTGRHALAAHQPATGATTN